MTIGAPTPPPEKRTRRRSGETRARLVDACLELIRAEGLAALSTQRITEAAGISQPGFYKHFRSLDELVEEAVGTVMQAMANQQVALHQLDVETEDDLPDLEARRAILDSMLSIFLSEPRIAELYLRYRNDPTILGGAITRLEARMVEIGTQYYWRVAQKVGVKPGAYERVAIFTEQSLALYERAAEMILSGRYDRELVIDTTNDALMALSDQLYETTEASSTSSRPGPPSSREPRAR